MSRTATLFFVALVAISSTPNMPDDSSLESITVSDIMADLHFLASDEMQGRAVGTPQNDKAAHYLARRFESMGLEPAGTEGFFQEFELTRGSISQPTQLQIRVGGTATRVELLRDFFPSPLSSNGKGSGGVVFAGYGITAPELGYDDYKGLDARGKIALVLDHEPREADRESVFDGLVLSDYGHELHKILNAQNHGAAGVIIAQDEANHARRGSYARAARITWPENVDSARFALKLWVDQIRIPAVLLSADKAGLFFPKGETLASLQTEIDRTMRPRSFLVRGAEATLETTISRQTTLARNVLAALPGSDPPLRSQWVVLGAHFDHVGVEGEEIFNGADDDASGTAGLLEVAQAFSAGKWRPARSVLFAAWNAEETGLLGSYYFVERPTIGLEDVAAMFQMDMIGRNEEVPDSKNMRFRGLQIQTADENANSVNILGYSRSRDLRSLADRANQRVGLRLNFRYDNQELGLLRRSDNWPFLTKGVPALFFHTGLHPDYHRPSDTPDKINYEKMAKVIRLVFLTSWEAASQPGRPRFAKEPSQ